MSLILTAAGEDIESLVHSFEHMNVNVIHMPLKYYELLEEDEFISDTFKGFDAYENIIHGSKRNAQFFLNQIEKHDMLEAVQQKVNFVINPETQSFLEEQGIVTILPHAKARPIDVLEFMIRFNRLGTTLYPSGETTQEEMPGLLDELGVAFNDLVVFKERGLSEDEITNFRIDIKTKEWSGILFHSRSSVNRFFTIQPDFDFGDRVVFAMNERAEERIVDFGAKEIIQLNSDIAKVGEILAV